MTIDVDVPEKKIRAASQYKPILRTVTVVTITECSNTFSCNTGAKLNELRNLFELN